MSVMMALEDRGPYGFQYATAPTLGELVRRARSAANITQAQLAECAGLSERGISDIERGVIASPNLATLQSLITALQLPPQAAREMLAARAPRARHRHLRPPQPLPTPLTPLVDRDDEVAQLSRAIFAPDTRLISLLGPGGVGKSRLALALATVQERSFRHRAIFVELEAATDLFQTMRTILQTLNASVDPWQPLHAQVMAALADRETLMVLDNVEQLALGAFVVDLLTNCPALRIVTTSRQPMFVRGEHRFQVGPLALPEATWRPRIEQLEEAPATALFLQCARRLLGDLPLDDQNRIDIVTICRLAEGVPLRIEQAASLLTTIPLSEIARQMQDPLACLQSAPADLPDRHRSLEASIRWSYDLLTADEQWLLRLLSAIDGEFTDDVVYFRARVTPGGPATPFGVAQCLRALVEKHLIHQTREGGGPRYTIPGHVGAFARHQTEIRAYAGTVQARG